MIKLDITKVNLIALYTGNKGYKICPCSCPCCSQKNVGGNYQGTLEQVELLLNKFSKLKQLYLFGNPDPVVDTEFCNSISKLAIKRGIHICYSTSGVGGKRKLQQLLNDIDPEYVDYISFSIDSVDKEKMNMLKGINYPFDLAIDGIEWANEVGFKTKIQPTLWSSNYMDVYDIIEYFSKIGTKNFSFHIGSIETNNIPTHMHLNPMQMKNVHNQIDQVTKIYNSHVVCPIIYSSCGSNDIHKWYCMNPSECHNWLAFLRENGVYATHVPIMSEFNDKYCFDISKPIYVEKQKFQETCPMSEKTAKEKTLCRYIAKTWN